jgi:hypothetical protein
MKIDGFFVIFFAANCTNYHELKLNTLKKKISEHS